VAATVNDLLHQLVVLPNVYVLLAVGTTLPKISRFLVPNPGDSLIWLAAYPAAPPVLIVAVPLRPISMVFELKCNWPVPFGLKLITPLASIDSMWLVPIWMLPSCLYH
jgi:hypothetical protein